MSRRGAKTRLHSVAVIAFDRISAVHVSVPCLVFGEERSELGVCAAESGKLRTTGGFSIEARHGVGQLARADLVIVPSWRDPNERPPEPLLAALRRAHARGRRVVGLCLGAFVLAEAGS